MIFESESTAYDDMAVCNNIKVNEYTAIAVTILSSGSKPHMFFQFGAILVNSRFVFLKFLLFMDDAKEAYSSLSIFTSFISNKAAFIPLNIAEYFPSGTRPMSPHVGHGPDPQLVTDILPAPLTAKPDANTVRHFLLLHIAGSDGMFYVLKANALLTGAALFPRPVELLVGQQPELPDYC